MAVKGLTGAKGSGFLGKLLKEANTILKDTEKYAYASDKAFYDPNKTAQRLESQYKKEHGLKTGTHPKIKKLDKERAMRIADAYEEMKHDPFDPQVRKSYEALANETIQQYKKLLDEGVDFEYWRGKGEPYKSSTDMAQDLEENNRLKVLATEGNFGQGPIDPREAEINPMLQKSGFKDNEGNDLLINDLFRGVHDYFGHTSSGTGFGAIGEENAWDVHQRMFSPDARRALTTETRGQNSWVNYGPQMRDAQGNLLKPGDPGYLSPQERAFADQKIGLLPDEFVDSDYYTFLENPTTRAAVKGTGAGLALAAGGAYSEDAEGGVLSVRPRDGGFVGSVIDAARAANAAPLEVLTSPDRLIRQGYLKPEHANNASMIGRAKKAYLNRFQTDPEFRNLELSVLPGDRGVVTNQVQDFDNRFYSDLRPVPSNREKLLGTQFDVAERQLQEKPMISIEELEGMPYVTSMSDRTAAGGELLGVKGSIYDKPIDLRGGQDYMFDPGNEGAVWASAQGPVSGIQWMAQDLYRQTGKNPLYLPWRMSPTGSDFSTMTTETLLTHARNNLAKSDINKANKQIKQIFPEFKGIENPESIEQLSQMSGDQRKGINQIMDRDYREKGGLSLPEARIAITDPGQYTAPDARLQNVGLIHATDPAFASTHPAYPVNVPGQGLGQLVEEVTPFDLNPEYAAKKGVEDPLNPERPAIRSLEMMNREGSSGIITDKVIEAIKARQGGFISPVQLATLTAVGGGLAISQDADATVIDDIARTIMKTADQFQDVNETGKGLIESTKDIGFPKPRDEAEALIYDELRTQEQRFGEKVFDPGKPKQRRSGAAEINRYELPSAYKEELEKIGVSTPDLAELDPQTGTKEFLEAINQAKKENKYGAAVHVYDEDDYKGMRLFLTDDGTAGYAIKPDGDIVSAFSTGKHEGVAPHLLLNAIEQGGNKLDAFDTILPNLYSRMGFKEVGRDTWDDQYMPEDWDKEVFSKFKGGEPDISYMEYSSDPSKPIPRTAQGPVDAAFDPAKRDSSNLLASMTPIAAMDQGPSKFSQGVHDAMVMAGVPDVMLGGAAIYYGLEDLLGGRDFSETFPAYEQELSDASQFETETARAIEDELVKTLAPGVARKIPYIQDRWNRYQEAVAPIKEYNPGTSNIAGMAISNMIIDALGGLGSGLVGSYDELADRNYGFDDYQAQKDQYGISRKSGILGY